MKIDAPFPFPPGTLRMVEKPKVTQIDATTWRVEYRIEYTPKAAKRLG